MEKKDLIAILEQQRIVKFTLEDKFPSPNHYSIAKRFAAYQESHQGEIVDSDNPIDRIGLEKERISTVESVYSLILGIEMKMSGFDPTELDLEGKLPEVNPYPMSDEGQEENEKRKEEYESAIQKVRKNIEQTMVDMVALYTKIADYVIDHGEEKMADKEFRKQTLVHAYGSVGNAIKLIHNYYDSMIEATRAINEAWKGLVLSMPIQHAKIIQPLMEELHSSVDDAISILKQKKELERIEIDWAFLTYS